MKKSIVSNYELTVLSLLWFMCFAYMMYLMDKQFEDKTIVTKTYKQYSSTIDQDIIKHCKGDIVVRMEGVLINGVTNQREETVTYLLPNNMYDGPELIEPNTPDLQIEPKTDNYKYLKFGEKVHTFDYGDNCQILYKINDVLADGNY